MLSRRSLRCAALLAVMAPAALAGCGGHDAASKVQAGAPTEGTASTSTTAAARDPGASPVDGLTAADLRRAIQAPLAPNVRTTTSPTADLVPGPGGSKVWRVRVPGTFQPRAARIFISIGGRVVGQAVEAADLQSIMTVVPDGGGLSSGAPVTYRWEDGPSVAAGRLVVIR